MQRLTIPRAGGLALLLAVLWGRDASAQAEQGVIMVTAQVVDLAPAESTVAAGARMVRVEPARLEVRRRREVPGATIFLDTPLDSTAAAPARRITIVHW